MMEAQVAISQAGSARPGTPYRGLTTSGSRPSTAPTPNLDCTKAVSSLPCCTVPNVGEQQKMISTDCQPSTPKAYVKYSEYSGPKPSPTNTSLLDLCKQENMDTILMRRRWKWIRHVIRKEQDNITKTALHWTLEGKRKRGRPKNTWRRTVEGELKTLHHTWGSVKTLAQDRLKWRSFVAALRASRHKGQ